MSRVSFPRVAVFGASVTQQRKGFAQDLSGLLKQKLEIFGYGGMHLNDAGICFIDNVLAAKPDYCLIDFFSTGYNQSSQETQLCIDTIIYKCVENNCKPIFLFFPEASYAYKKEFHNFCKALLCERRVFFIDLLESVGEFGCHHILRDQVHTNSLGSRLYASTIYPKLLAYMSMSELPPLPDETKYLRINKISVGREFAHIIHLSGNAEIIGFYLTIGPHSGLIKIIDHKRNKNIMYNIKDKWCYYNRKHFNMSFLVDGYLTMQVMQENMKGIQGGRYFWCSTNKLIIHDIYFIGEKLMIHNLNDGLKINFTRLRASNIVSRFKRAVSRFKRSSR